MTNMLIPLRSIYKHSIILVFMLLCVSVSCIAQQITVTGKVVNAAGEPLAGASIKEKNAAAATITNEQGVFSITVKSGAILLFSFTGYQSQEIKIANQTTLDVTLAPGEGTMEEVVVTALGINRQSKALTYSSQKVTAEELTTVPQTNFINSLSGKVAGLSVSNSPAGVGGSVKVILRGNKSAQRGNQPLYVIDGVPLLNFAQEVSSVGLNQDYGDAISNLNPEDIESITVLKGASSAALYGSQASNGVIVITTKKGKAGQSKVEVNSSITLDKVALTPELQDSYGQTNAGSDYSWGAPLATKQPDHIKDFFRTGSTFVNGVSLSSGSDKFQHYLSYSNTKGNSILPNNSVSRHNVNLHTTNKYFNNKVTVDANANFVLNIMDNPPYSGLAYTPMWGLYIFPRGLDFGQYKEYAVYNIDRKLMTQNWWRTPDDRLQNPYWVMNKMLNRATTNRIILKMSAKWDITDWLNIQARGNIDRGNVVTTSKWHAGTAQVIVGQNGYYSISNINRTQYYGDVLLNFNKSFKKINVGAIVGSSILDTRTQGETHSSIALYIANVFNMGNMNPLSNSTTFSAATPNRSQLQAVFGSVNFSYDDWLFLDVTGRNDWSSNLSFTSNLSYFYPSVGASAVLNDVLKLPKVISMAKLRASYAIVGNTVPNYVTNPINTLARGGSITFNTTAPFYELNPEKSKSLEIGTDLRFFNDRLSADFTYYKTNTINQFFAITVPAGTGYSRRFVNGGDIQNSGVEIMLNAIPVSNAFFKWSTTLNFSTNKNKIKELTKGVDQFTLTSDAGFYSILKVNGSYGDMFANVYDRDSAGRVRLDVNNKPIVKPGTPTYVGNSNPKHMIGWSNNFSYKDFTVGFLIDGRFGFEVLSITQAWLDNYGLSKVSGEARTKGGVEVSAVNTVTNQPVSTVTPYNWYFGIPYGETVFDGSVVRVRELSIGYQLNQRKLKSKFVKGISLALIGRNLVYLYRPAPVDSEIIFSNGNGFSGMDAFGVPPTKSFGFNLNVRF